MRVGWAFVAALCAAGIGCGEEPGVPPPGDRLYYPVGLAPHPDGRYLYVTNAVFDRLYNASTVVVYDTFERRILERATVRVGLFASELFVGRPAAGEGQVVGYLGTRDDDRLVALEIDAAAGEAPGHLRCGEDADRTCGGPNVIGRLDGIGTSPRVFDDPYSIAVDEQGLIVTHVGRGEISRWSLNEGGLTRPLGLCSLNLQGGASSVAVHPQLGWAYVTDRGGQLVETLEILPPADRGVRGIDLADACRIETHQPILVDGFSTRGRTRGLAFSADGTLLFLASTSDAALRIYDTSVGGGGIPENRLVASIPLGSGPNVVRVAGLRPGERRASTALLPGPVSEVVDERGGGLVYVTAFEDDQLFVIDPTLLAVVARIEVGGGPHEIAFMPDGSGALRAWVGLFGDHRIAVVDIEPGSPSRFQLIASVPSPPR